MKSSLSSIPSSFSTSVLNDMNNFSYLIKLILSSNFNILLCSNLDSYLCSVIVINPQRGPVVFSNSFISLYCIDSILYPLLVSIVILNILPQIKQINALNLNIMTIH